MIRIGLVDDDKEHQKLIRQFICRYEKEEQTKICVKEYTDGLQFLEEYEGNLDVVFLDIEMPHMDVTEQLLALLQEIEIYERYLQ